MAVDRQHGRLVFACDTCEEQREFAPGVEFADAWHQLMADGWKADKVGSEWVHGCRTCGV